MATWTIPQSSDALNGPFDNRVYFYDGQKTHGASHVPGNSGPADVALVQGSGLPAAVNPTVVRKDAQLSPVDNRTLFYDGQKTHYTDPGILGDQPAPTGAPVAVSRL